MHKLLIAHLMVISLIWSSINCKSESQATAEIALVPQWWPPGQPG